MLKKLPFFLPLAGCRGQCVYCDQRAITGVRAVPSPADVREALRGLTGPREICYFGGSFCRFAPQLIKEYQRNNNADNPTVQKPYLAALDKLQLLLIDDWGMDEITRAQCFSLYEMIKRIKPHCSFLITSVIPVKECWAQYLGDPTLADSILDRLVPNSYRIEIKGDSMRSKEEYGALPKNK